MSEKHARLVTDFALTTLARRPHRRSGVGARRLERQKLNPETLEERRLLAVGPQLVSIQPNSGDVLSNGVAYHVAPQELTFIFDEAQQIDANTLDGIQIFRAGFDDTFDGVTDVMITPGYAGVDEDRPNEVSVRFAEALPDDRYRIQIYGVDDPIEGIRALRNVEGAPFHPSLSGTDRTAINFELDLGATVLAVVPQPITRHEDGSLLQAKDQIEVHFNPDPLDEMAAIHPGFYSLVFTNETVENTDDTIFHPESVSYDSQTNLATLTFASDLEALSTGRGSYRLRIGSDAPLPGAPEFEEVTSDPGSSFDTAHMLDTLDSALVIRGEGIFPEPYPLDFPGSTSEPGHREINEVQDHFAPFFCMALRTITGALSDNMDDLCADTQAGISVIPYNFKSVYGWDVDGNPLLNLITEEQKQRSREIFEVYSYYLGIDFVETFDEGLTVVTGDLRAIDATTVPGPLGVIGIAGDANPDPYIYWPTAVMDTNELWDDTYGESLDFGRDLDSSHDDRLSWYDTAMHEIGHLLGVGHTDELPELTVMNDESELSFTNSSLATDLLNVVNRPEPIFPGQHDIVHGQFIHRPDGNDIDIYRFELETGGDFTAEIIAERQANSSGLDSVLTVYRATDSGPEVVARNDDYFSEDSFIGLRLEAGTYYVVVSSTGNTAFDPTIEGTGLGGTSQGVYDLRLGFQPLVDNFLVDATGIALDGDADGVPGGDFNHWFRVEDAEHAIYVDKVAPSGGDGSLSTPYNNLGVALAAADATFGDDGGIVRVVGNGGMDGDVATLADNVAYELGINEGRALSDGANLLIPSGVTMMVDAGAMFKLLKTNIHVGSSSVTIDRSGASLQVLGTPAANVVFTSYDDQTRGVDTNPRQTTPSPGDWGGLIFQNDLDRAEGRFDYEQIGGFLNTVNQATLLYGGGNVTIDSVQQVINPIHMVDARPTISYNRIEFSADAALSANPDSFEETNYSGVDSLGIDYQAVPFTSDYDRIGPDLRGNRVTNNSINGLFVRIQTPAGQALEVMNVAGRWDDTDIVHVIAENLVIGSTPGGPIQPIFSTDRQARTDAQLKIDPGITVKLNGVRIETQIGSQLLAEGVSGREVVFTSRFDNRYGAGGTFNTNGPTELKSPAPGDWSGIYVAAAGRASIDNAVISFAGGLSRTEGSFAQFNAIEVHQGELRLVNSTLTESADGWGGQAEPTRSGHLRNEPAAIYIRSAQPIIVNNVIKGTRGQLVPAISIDVNSLNHRIVTDIGRSTGTVSAYDQIIDNEGPLVRFNRLGGNSVNGMQLRGATLTTESVWDDTDIVHVLFDEVVVPNLHTFGGLRLESSPSESLVVKLHGSDAGLKASGLLLDIDDRVGGSVHVLGQPGRPVVMTSLADDTVGAGFDPLGSPQTDTDGFRRAKAGRPPGSFELEVNYGPIIREKPEFVAAIEEAARLLEYQIEDPIRVVVDVELGERGQNFAVTETVGVDWDQARQLMINDGREHEVDLLAELPVFGNATFTLPEDSINPYQVGGMIEMTRANAMALGLAPQLCVVRGVDVTEAPCPVSQYDTTEMLDGAITFSPNPLDTNGTPTFWDMDRSDGITPDYKDFTMVAMHEMMHVLGFISGVRQVQDILNSPDPRADIWLNTVDMFRLEPGDGSVDFANSARVVDPDLDQVFYDGGIFDPHGITAVPGLRLGDIPMSTGGDGNQPSHLKDLDGEARIGFDPRNLGLMDPVMGYGEGELTHADLTILDYIGWDIVGDPIPGDWRGITLEQYSNDRNLGVVIELEDPSLPAPGENALPGTAQVLGALGRSESANDENLRLGFVVHGALDERSDVDVYSFTAMAGTEIWLDVDKTSSHLDAVVELIDADGNVLARSDNSFAEKNDLEDRFAAKGVFVEDLQKSLFYKHDYYSQNLFDPGMRVVLPGAGLLATYHVRVRSSSDDLADTTAGLTYGSYELQIRLSEVDEHAGSTVQFADIRYANDGVRIKGLPQHSNLMGEVREDVWESPSGQLLDNNDDLPVNRNEFDFVNFDNSRALLRTICGAPECVDFVPVEWIDRFQDAQFIGNVLQSDRGAISLAGHFDSLDDVVDWYLFEVRFDSVQQEGNNTVELTFDVDYADGLSRADSTISIYETNFVETTSLAGPELQSGDLIYRSEQGGGPDDRPGPLQGPDLDDLSRGSVGLNDPFVGPISLPEGFYLLQISNPRVTQTERLQYTEELPPNAFSRFEPVESVQRIAEDRIGPVVPHPLDGTLFTTADNPTVPVLLDPIRSPVPFTLADVQLFVSRSNSISAVDPFSGGVEVAYGRFAGIEGLGESIRIGDFALRDNPEYDADSADPNKARGQRLLAFANDTGEIASDATVGNYVWLDITEETEAERPGSPVPVRSTAVRSIRREDGSLGDDFIITHGPDPESEDPEAPTIVVEDLGVIYDAITFNDSMPDVKEGYAIGKRGGVVGVKNILVRFDATNGQARSAFMGGDQPEEERIPIPSPIPDPPAFGTLGPGEDSVPMRQPNAGFNIVEQGVLDTTAERTIDVEGEDVTIVGPGGDVTGLAFVGGNMYGVSDSGGLYRVINYASESDVYPPAAARLRPIATIFDPNTEPGAEPKGIRFEGLAAGPKNVEGGRYADLLFGISRTGDLYAFDIEGVLQPVFANGAITVSTGVSGVTGLDFGRLTENLWQVTDVRGADPGHGRLFPTPVPGGNSFYFGEDLNDNFYDPRYYDFLGDAHGSLVTNEFSLAGYDDSHGPYVYFTYFLATERSFDDPTNGEPPRARDTFRVFIADDQRELGRGQWHLLASNQPNEVGIDEAGLIDTDLTDDITIDVQPLFDNTWQDIPAMVETTTEGFVPSGGRDSFPFPDDVTPIVPVSEEGGVWRQARISLADFSDSDSLRLRFDFATAGSFDVGGKGGVELRAVPGAEILDGDTFQIDNVMFEFDSGYTVVARGGRAIRDGETLTVTDETGDSVTFEMDQDGQVVLGNVAISYTDDSPASEIANEIETQLILAGLNTDTFLDRNRLNLKGAADIQLSADGGLVLDGSTGVNLGAIAVPIHTGMSARQVALAMVQPLADMLADDVTDAIKLYDNSIILYDLTVRDQGPLGLTSQLPGDRLGSFDDPKRSKNWPDNGGGRNDQAQFGDPEDEETSFTVPFEGVYVDDLIIGFTNFGERAADLRPGLPYEEELTFLSAPVGVVTEGEYQIEVRRASDFSDGMTPHRTFDPRDRLSKNVSIRIPEGADIFDGQTFFISDGLNTINFEFDETFLDDGVAEGNVSVPFSASDTAFVIAAHVRDAVNLLFLTEALDVSAAGTNGEAVASVGQSALVNLFGPTVTAGGDMEVVLFDESGSSNTKRDQGQIVIFSNSISHSAGFGIVVEDALRDFPCKNGSSSDPLVPFCSYSPFDVADVEDHAQGTAGDYTPSFGVTRNLRELNLDDLVPGVVIANNVVAFGAEGGIHFSGDPGGHAVIAPVGAPWDDTLPPEVADDEELHYWFAITDNNGDTETFEFGTAEHFGELVDGDEHPFNADVRVIWSYTDPPDVCLYVHQITPCIIRNEMTEAMLTGLAESSLDIIPYRTRPDEMYIDGAREIISGINGAVSNWMRTFTTKVQASAVPFGRIVNNTIVGLGGELEGANDYDADDFDDVGIVVDDNADPTLLNNVIVNFATGIRVDQTALTTIIGGNLFQGNVDNAENIGVGDFAIELANDDPLFVDRSSGNFYPADGSLAIDSAVDTVEDRSELKSIKEAMGIGPSPIQSPDYDVLGQLRIDDPRVETPEGFGEDVFKDRGAIDRVDFQGAIAQFQLPRDNDLSGVDLDSTQDRVRVEDAVLTAFVVQLVDLGEATAPTGTGIDNSSVTVDSVILRRDGEVLEPGVDYRFDYQPTTNQILLTPLAGVWLTGFIYEIELVNRDRYNVITGDYIADGASLRVMDENGGGSVFEIETGVSIRVPSTLTIQVTAGTSGLSAVSDGELFTISNGLRLVAFEFDSNGVIVPGRIAVPFQPSSTPDQVADAIVAAVDSASLGLAPRNLGAGKVHIGGSIGTVLDTGVSSLEQFGQPGVFIDGQTFLIRDQVESVRFEFDQNDDIGSNNLAVSYDDNATQQELAEFVIDSINGAGLSVTAVLGPNGIINLSRVADLSVLQESSGLHVSGEVGLQSTTALPVIVSITEDLNQEVISESIQDAIASDSTLSRIATIVDEAGQLVVIGATSVTGMPVTFIEGVRDVAGNLLRTNQDEEPFSTLMVVDLPAPLDFGDAPDPTYSTRLSSNGARHVVVPNIQLGATNSAELDRLEIDDSDDGILFENVLTPGGSTRTLVFATTEGFIDAWVDLDADGSFDDQRDRIFNSLPVVRGSNELRIQISTDAAIGDTYARFRFSTAGGLLPTGRAGDGEVEDHSVQIVAIQPPVATDDNYRVDEDELLIVGVAQGLFANDSSGFSPTASITLASNPVNGAVILNADGSFTYQPDPDFFGLDEFEYFMMTDLLKSNRARVVIEVSSVTDAPVAVDDDFFFGQEDTPAVIDVLENDRDPDGSLVRSSVNVVTDPQHGSTTVSSNGIVTYVPEPDFFGTDTFEYTVMDSDGATSRLATVTVFVEGRNDPPIANDDQLFVRRGSFVEADLLVNDVDIDGTLDPGSIVITLSPKSGVITFTENGTIVFSPDPTFIGVDTFRYTVQDDGEATSNQAVVMVTVSVDNTPPVAVDDSATTPRSETVQVDLVANDFDPDGSIVPGSIMLVESPQNGDVTFGLDGTATYVPRADFVGQDEFRYTVRDEFNDVSNVATVRITVQDTTPPWQNPNNPLDVDGNGLISPLDALQVINDLNSRGSRPLDPPPLDTDPSGPPPYIDVDGNNLLTPLDALLVINALNANAVGAVAAAKPVAEISGQQDIAAALHIEPRRPLESVNVESLDQALHQAEKVVQLDPVTWENPAADTRSPWDTDEFVSSSDDELLDVLASDRIRFGGSV